MTHRIITRRDSLRLLGISGAASLAPAFILPNEAQALGTCQLSPELTAGPYYIDRERTRENIVDDRPGIPLQIRITVLHAQSCVPLRNVAVDIWHCDARGLYSGYTSVNPDTDDNDARQYLRKMGSWPPPADQQTYLRGVQMTNARGVVEFTSIYPGWYYGRPTHVHVRVHSQAVIESDHINGGNLCHTGQFCFPDEMNDRVAATASYAGHKLVRVRNDQDWIFDEHSAALSMFKLRQAKRELERGVIGEVTVAVDPAAMPMPQRPNRPAPGAPAS